MDMRFYTPIMICFILGLTVLGIFDNLDSWNWLSFVMGVVIFIPVFTVWLSSKAAAKIFLGMGATVLMFAASGWLERYTINRVFFSGAIVGCLAGFVPAYFFQKSRFLDAAIVIAEIEEYKDVEKYLRKKRNVM